MIECMARNKDKLTHYYEMLMRQARVTFCSLYPLENVQCSMDVNEVTGTEVTLLSRLI